MNITENQIIGELVAQDYRSAEVFAGYGIDFCCKGGQTLKDVCDRKKLNLKNLITDLKEITASSTEKQEDYQSWPLDLLADYIEKTHHRYVVNKTPAIQQYLTKVTQVHGNAHHELAEILEHFNKSA